jgi:regulator of protease activity HflC (stomatin/prohibitin superfamily)
MDTVSALVTLALLAGAIWGASRLLRREVVFEYQHAVRFARGRYAGLLPAGAHWIFKPTTSVRYLDARPRVVTIPGQEILSSDAVSLKISLVLDIRVVDPRAATLGAQSFEETLYAAAQIALRDAVGAKTIEEVLGARAQLAAQLKPVVEPAALALGLELRSIAVKDIMLPGALKETFSEAARARHEAQAALERARGESATLRNLANSARLLDGNPALAQVRLLQAASTADKLIINYTHAGATGRGVATDEAEP